MTPRPVPPRDDADARLDRWLARARPPAARGRAGEASAVRVLARLAAVEGGELEARRAIGARASRPGKGTARERVVALTAAVVVAAAVGVLASAFVGGGREASSGDEARARVVAAAEAAAPEPTTRARPAPAPTGPSPADVRDRWLTIAEAHAPDAADALRELARVGGPCGAAEAARVAALHRDGSLASLVREVLADAPGDAGPQALAASLLAAHAAAADAASASGAAVGGPAAGDVAALVGALERVARRGRATLALDGLRRAADAGCAEAAIGALRVAGTAELDRALAAVAARPAVRPAFVEAVALRPRVLGAALLRRVERGDRGALALAAAARVEGLGAVLRPFVTDGARAAAAVAALGEVGDGPSVETLALALAGPAAREARRVLVSLGAAAVTALESAAVAASMDATADPFVTALAGLGDAGLPALLALAERPTLSVRVVRALSTSPAERASEALAALASKAALTRVVVDALGVRRAAGDPTAAAALAEASRGTAVGAGVAAGADAGLAVGGRGAAREPVVPVAPTVPPVAPRAGATDGAGGTDGPGASGPGPATPGTPGPARPAGRGPARPTADGPGVPTPRPPSPPVAPPRVEPPTPRAPAPPPAPGGRSKSI